MKGQLTIWILCPVCGNKIPVYADLKNVKPDEQWEILRLCVQCQIKIPLWIEEAH